MGLARATRNLARTARANPMWALLGILLAPFRFVRHVFVAGVFAVALFLGLFALLLLSIWVFDLDKNGVVALIGMIAAVVLVTACRSASSIPAAPCSPRMKSVRCAPIASSCSSPGSGRSSPPSCATMPIASSPGGSIRRERSAKARTAQ
jgi:hypothetical protein